MGVPAGSSFEEKAKLLVTLKQKRGLLKADLIRLKASKMSEAYVAATLPRLEDELRLTEDGIVECAPPHQLVAEAQKAFDKLTKQRADHETVYEAAKEAAADADKKLRLARQDRHHIVVLLQNAEAALDLAKQTQAAAKSVPPSAAPAAALPPAVGGRAPSMAEAFKQVADFLRAGGTPADDVNALLIDAAAEGRSKQGREAPPHVSCPGRQETSILRRGTEWYASHLWTGACGCSRSCGSCGTCGAPQNSLRR